MSRTIDLPLEQSITAGRLSRPSPLNLRTLAVVLWLGAVLWSFGEAGFFGADVVNRGGWPLAWRFVRASIRPDVSGDMLRLALHSTLITLAFAVCGAALSLVIGAAGGILSTQLWWQAAGGSGTGRGQAARTVAPWIGIRAGLALPRAIHEVIWGLFLINIVGLDPIVAILAIGIPFGAITAKVFAEIVDETPREALVALQTAGVPRFQAMCYGVLPRAFPDLLSYTFYRFECAIRAAAVMGLIGAGGLGYQLLLSLQSLRYEQMWTLLYALMLLSGLTDLWSSVVRRRMQLASRIDLKARQGPRKTVFASTRDPIANYSLLAAAALVPFSFWYVQADVSKLVAPRTTQLLARVLRDAMPIRVDAGFIHELWHLSAQTLSMSILAMTLAGLGGLLLSFPAATNLALPGGSWDTRQAAKGQMLRGMAGLLAARGVLLVARAISEPIWAFIFLFVLFPGVLPGALGLGLYNLGILGRLMAEVNENVDNRPLRALHAQAASGGQVFLYGVLPATVPKYLAYVLYRWEVCIRATVIVGLVGAGGLGRVLAEQLSSFDYRSVATTLVFFFGLTFLVDLTSAAARRVIR